MQPFQGICSALWNEYVHYSIRLATSIQVGAVFEGKNGWVMCPRKVLETFMHVQMTSQYKRRKYWLYLFWLHFFAKP